ncbi:MAG: AbrB/MazE/SpoVT family DNA-binding domain-containing protein [Candidatus Magnetominusculus sp. LBB02]|nr:AbrB/MazE/SpoVT family DNA-binding domain-containing protein [Candidatus Magnetominusculus sp. LBB02]
MIKTINWGGSVAVIIPQAIAKNLYMSSGTQVEIKELEGKIVIEPVKETLDKLVNGVTEENRHEEFSFGHPVGKEVW